MKIKDINDKNTLNETFLEWFIRNNFDVTKMGFLGHDEEIGIYLIVNKENLKYTILTTDWDKWNNKRIKKNETRWKKSATFYYPLSRRYFHMNEDVFNNVCDFIMGKDSCEIFFEQLQSDNMIGVVQGFLSKNP